jgi:hypothetical protein
MAKNQVKMSLKQRKANYKSKVLNLLPKDKKITREELHELTGLSDRRIRQETEEISMLFGVLTNSQEKGVRLVNMEVNTTEDIDKEIEEINHSINEHKKRASIIVKKCRALIADKKVLEKRRKELDTSI